MHAAVEACCVTGASLGQPLALVMLNLEAMKEAAGADGRSALERSLAEHLESINATLDPHEQLDCIVVTKEAWTVENDLITPTFKVKRNRIEERFAALLRAVGAHAQDGDLARGLRVLGRARCEVPAGLQRDAALAVVASFV